MAVPIAFRPSPVDPHLELMRRLNAAPREHAEALLVAYDLLQTAHDKGILDTVNGLVSAKDTIFGKLAEYAKLPEGIAGIRNLLSGLKILTSIDPELLDHLSRAMVQAAAEHRKEEKPPSLFQITKRVFSEDSRRALSFLTLALTGIGKSLKS
ncbi:DUF1641 domain-containing protein [Granulicella arctica]|uniref:DUF1641 domain-containing protein n=1 Tax=Granulicella arctica TaxID=940613 RepID=UPI0021E0D731|nr:DUF1641 domain-containing protein [Granulicella arctica]